MSNWEKALKIKMDDILYTMITDDKEELDRHAQLYFMLLYFVMQDKLEHSGSRHSLDEELKSLLYEIKEFQIKQEKHFEAFL